MSEQLSAGEGVYYQAVTTALNTMARAVQRAGPRWLVDDVRVTGNRFALSTRMTALCGHVGPIGLTCDGTAGHYPREPHHAVNQHTGHPYFWLEYGSGWLRLNAASAGYDGRHRQPGGTASLRYGYLPRHDKAVTR